MEIVGRCALTRTSVWTILKAKKRTVYYVRDAECPEYRGSLYSQCGMSSSGRGLEGVGILVRGRKAQTLVRGRMEAVEHMLPGRHATHRT